MTADARPGGGCGVHAQNICRKLTKLKRVCDQGRRIADQGSPSEQLLTSLEVQDVRLQLLRELQAVNQRTSDA